MKSHTAKNPPQAAAGPVPQPLPINITVNHEKLRECSAKTGRSAGEFISDLLREGIEKLEYAYLTSIPCPFCGRANNLDIISWNHERPDLTEYQGEVVRCNNCDAIAPLASWAKRGLSFEHGTAACKGGAA
jgi:hypothetical protein